MSPIQLHNIWKFQNEAYERVPRGRVERGRVVGVAVGYGRMVAKKTREK